MLTREWFTAQEIADMQLSDMPATKAGVHNMAAAGHWGRPDWENHHWRVRTGRGGGYEYRYTLLPPAARAQIIARFTALQTPDATAIAEDGDRAALWQRYDALADKHKAEAKRRVLALEHALGLQRSGIARTAAMKQAAALNNIAVASLYNWAKLCEHKDRSDWLAAVAPGYSGNTTQTAVCSDDAWAAFKADFLRLEKPTASACYRRLQAMATAHGWTIPARKTLERRIAREIPRQVIVLLRDGTEALKRTYPAQRRDRSLFRALEAVNADGHKWDVFVRWPDGSVQRPMMTAFQDLRSGKILSWRVDTSENTDAVRLALGDLVAQYGIPKFAYFDNGRHYASKMLTGGARNRFRFKIKPEDPVGIMQTLGIEVAFVQPYSGQSKPIERAFRDFASDYAKHPAFAGAYTGNTPNAKPENYASKAVPLDDFIRIAGESIREHNARRGRTGGICNGRSFDEVFAEDYAIAPIRKATAAQRRLWLLAADGVRADRDSGTITLANNRYYADFLSAHAGQKLIARFDPDAMHGSIHVYTLAGAYLGEAPCVAAVGFNDSAAAREHARLRRHYMNTVRDIAALERKLSAADIATLLPATNEDAAPPQSRVVKLFTQGSAALQPRAEEDTDEHENEDAFVKAMQLRTDSPQLHLVHDDD